MAQVQQQQSTDTLYTLDGETIPNARTFFGSHTVSTVVDTLDRLRLKIETHYDTLLSQYRYSDCPEQLESFLDQIATVRSIVQREHGTFARELDPTVVPKEMRRNGAFAQFLAHLGEVCDNFIESSTERNYEHACDIYELAEAIQAKQKLFVALYEISNTQPEPQKFKGIGFGARTPKAKKKKKLDSLPPAPKKKPIRSFQEYSKDFCSQLERVSDSKHPTQVFRDWAEMTALVLAMRPYQVFGIPPDDAYERYKNDFLAERKRYTDKEFLRLDALAELAKECIINHRRDMLGPVYMEYSGKSWNGEFFTPHSLAKMMARQIAGDGKELQRVIDENGCIQVSDPACGAGVMLLTFTEAVEEALCKDDVTPYLYVHAVDVNRTCFNIASIQLGLIGLLGHVIHGNTLSLETAEVRPTMALRVAQYARERDPAYRMLQFIREIEKKSTRPEPQQPEPDIVTSSKDALEQLELF